AHDLLEQNFETRTGYGFDVHAFDNDAADHVRLCGIDIPHSQKLKGHSDADVVLHAITDALLGAIGQGDIGQHFPPSDDQWKGKDSAYFLEQAIEMLERQSAAIINIDVTIICEAPKIVPHREAMIERLHGITKVEQSRINIKATTTEQLGFTGRKEGIATQAIANVRLPVSQ
ncbi:MAG: 2-C-methyl-D-erythritol 2,4-cyclodiphosphate synthase, partial [Pseudomonadota bacterium]